MTDKKQEEAESKKNVPILIIVVCASFTMIVQTIASSLSVMGYDEVIRADAKARAAQILQRVDSGKECKVPNINLIQRINALEDKQEQLIIDNDSLKLLAHEAG